MIEFACPACNNKLRLKDELAGRKVKCPRCGEILVVPTPSAVVAPAGPTEAAPRPPASEDATVAPKDSLPPADGRRDTHGDADATGGARGSGNPLTDFLAPPLGPGEIGRLGPYRVLKVLGAGGMGVVFQAEDPGLQRLVALKAMLPGLAASAASRERFIREARSAAAVEHDHIVAIYQVGEDRGVPYLAMPFLRGEPLDVKLKREKRLPTAEVLRIARETAAGLEAARQRGMIHRDIKPGNLWLEEGTGRIKILDFGLARAADDEGHLTQQGAILGTPAYMAPEQAGGKADHRSDLFSLGCVIYRMATGEPAFQGSDAISTLMAIATEPARPPRDINPDVPPGLSDLILRLLAKKPEERPASAQAVVEMIRVIEAQPKASRSRPSELKKSGPQRFDVAPAPADVARSGQQRLGGAPARPKPAADAVPPSPPRVAAGKGAAKPAPKQSGGAALWLVLSGLVLVAALAVGGWMAWPYLPFSAAPPNVTPPVTPADLQEAGKTPKDPPEPVHNGLGGIVHPSVNLFNGKDFVGWTLHKGRLDNWGVDNGVLYTRGLDSGWMMTDRNYSDFELRLEYRIFPHTNTGVAIRAPLDGNPSYMGMEIQIIDDAGYKNLKSWDATGAIWGVTGPTRPAVSPTDKWNRLKITAVGRKVTVEINDVQVQDADLDRYKDQLGVHPGLINVRGRIGLQSGANRAEFRDIVVRRLTEKEEEEKAP